MKNKIIKFTIFLFYSWCIYQSYFYIAIPILAYEMYEEAGYLPLYFIQDNLLFFIFLIPALVLMIVNIPLHINEIGNILPLIIPFLPLLLLLVILYPCVLAFWWKKQTILRAWCMALLGMFGGPGLILVLRPLGDGGVKNAGLASIAGINIFYFLLFVGNYLQKKYWPENRICNRIRVILQWPCLRT